VHCASYRPSRLAHTKFSSSTSVISRCSYFLFGGFRKAESLAAWNAFPTLSWPVWSYSLSPSTTSITSDPVEHYPATTAFYKPFISGYLYFAGIYRIIPLGFPRPLFHSFDLHRQTHPFPRCCCSSKQIPFYSSTIKSRNYWKSSLMSPRWTPFLALLALMSGASSEESPPAGSTAATLDQDFYNYIFIVLSSLIVVLAIWRIGIESVKYVRTLTCLDNERQLYFVKPSAVFASFKKHIIYAPIFRKRHSKEFKLSAAVNVGTVPTRLQLLFITSYFGTNVAFCVVGIDWSQPITTVALDLRNRSGIIAVVNLVSHPLCSIARRSLC
jgi:hypothetical protein